jgi:hypothetical protein
MMASRIELRAVDEMKVHAAMTTGMITLGLSLRCIYIYSQTPPPIVYLIEAPPSFFFPAPLAVQSAAEHCAYKPITSSTCIIYISFLCVSGWEFFFGSKECCVRKTSIIYSSSSSSSHLLYIYILSR